MKKFIAGGIAAAAIAVVPGVALAAPAFADAHGFDPQQIHNVLENLGQQAQQGGAQAQAPTQDADAQQAPTQDATNQQQGAVQPVSKQREFQIGISQLGIGDNSQLVELRGPADKIFQGGHPVVGQKHIGIDQYVANPGGLPGIVHAKYNLLDPNGQVQDTVSMDMVVLQTGPNNPPKLDLRNVQIENNTVQSTGVQFDAIGDVVDSFFRNT
jgi:hypothetical protein